MRTERSKASGAARTRRGRRDQPREAILQAALTVFSERGFKGATLRQIARLARVNHNTIRWHFGSKDRLWRAAVSFLFERQERELDVGGLARQGLDARAFLREVLARYVRYCARHPEHARIAVLESVVGGERLRWMSREHIRRLHDAVGPYLAASMKAGLVRPTSEVSLLYALALASQSVFLLDKEARSVHGVDPFDEAFVEEHVQTVLGMVLR